jgi:hypothetical protein
MVYIVVSFNLQNIIMIFVEMCLALSLFHYHRYQYHEQPLFQNQLEMPLMD